MEINLFHNAPERMERTKDERETRQMNEFIVNVVIDVVYNVGIIL